MEYSNNIVTDRSIDINSFLSDHKQYHKADNTPIKINKQFSVDSVDKSHMSGSANGNLTQRNFNLADTASDFKKFEDSVLNKGNKTTKINLASLSKEMKKNHNNFNVRSALTAIQSQLHARQRYTKKPYEDAYSRTADTR